MKAFILYLYCTYIYFQLCVIHIVGHIHVQCKHKGLLYKPWTIIPKTSLLKLCETFGSASLQSNSFSYISGDSRWCRWWVLWLHLLLFGLWSRHRYSISVLCWQRQWADLYYHQLGPWPGSSQLRLCCHSSGWGKYWLIFKDHIPQHLVKCYIY